LAATQAAERKRKREENEEAMHAAAKKITTLARPKGEAGSMKKGFNLQEAMGLNGSSDKALLYNEIMVRHPWHAWQGVTDIWWNFRIPIYL